jgi:hypothetical protein
MTQDYLIGELSALLGDLQPGTDGHLGSALQHLRHRVEHVPVWRLAPLAREAMSLAGVVCWVALERGDLVQFAHEVNAAAALRDFTDCANLLI